MPTIESSPLGIYISVPFCRSKCSYCNFASGVFGPEKMDAYVNRLLEEIHLAPRQMQNWAAVLSGKADSIYFGGGTPSLLSCMQLKRILNAVRDVFKCAPDAEVTLECAPGQLSDDLLAALPPLGFNRVSLGVQSFVDREAAAVGRLHSRCIAFEEISRLRGVGIQDINIDLIAGLPHQTPESWQASLDDAIATGAPHLSVYMLDVDEDSRLGREMLAGGVRYGVAKVPEDEAIATMYSVACERFVDAGIGQYEISNFARDGRESRHNLKYWNRQPYVGFGLDAHSFLPVSDGTAIRVGMTDDLSAYLDRSVGATVTPVSDAEAIEETWFLGLRLSVGVSLPLIEKKIGHAAMNAFQPILDECEREGLLVCDATHVRLTQQGRLFSSEVFTRFLGVLSSEDVSHPMKIKKQGVFA